MSRVLDVVLNNRAKGKRSLCVYINAGDPNIDLSERLIELCDGKGVDLIELGIPFANSFTDGQSVLQSHARALKSQTTLESVLAMANRLRRRVKIPLVLLADFSYTVKPFGLDQLVPQAKDVGIDSILLHGLPPLFTEGYLALTAKYGLAPVFSLYPNSKGQVITQCLKNTKSFIYLVSQYGRTGATIDFESPELQEFYQRTRQATSLPLLAGFGIKNEADLQKLFSSSAVDGAIIGSAITRIIENSGSDLDQILQQTSDYLERILPCTHIGYPPQRTLEVQREHTA